MAVLNEELNNLVDSTPSQERQMKVLLVSNGAGEDACGAWLALELLRQMPNLVLEAIPLVGRGMAYERAGIRVSGPRLEMPSGGFMTTGQNVLLADLKAGFVQMSRDQYWAIRRSKPDVVLVVGDIYATWAVRSFTRKDGCQPPVFHYQSLVSLYYQDGMSFLDKLKRGDRYLFVDSFNPVERFLMRSTDRMTFVRDERSAQWLRGNGVPNAKCVGSVMMDMLEPELSLTPILKGKPVVALLPGTRNDHLFSLPLMLEAVATLIDCQTLIALPLEHPDSIVLPTNWTWVSPNEAEKSVSATMTALHTNGLRVPILSRAFAALLHQALVVVGTSGTGNEQAVGLGKPVIGFATQGPQYLESFAQAQGRLLGAGLQLVEPKVSAIRDAVQEALSDPRIALDAQHAGAERMGQPGASKRIIDAMLNELK
jgi:uncharacterized protein (TIGR03492 family)